MLIDGGGAGIWVANADGTGAREVTAIGDVVDGSPSWSPDGTQIAYSRDGVIAGNSAQRIWVVNVDGTGDHMLLDESGSDPTWSPDGTQIAYSSNGDIWIVDAQGANPQQVTSSSDDEIFPSWGVGRAVEPGAEVVTVPDLLGLSMDQARAQLDAVGLTVGEVQVVTGIYVKEAVVEQDPAAGTSVDVGTTVDLVTGPGGAG